MRQVRGKSQVKLVVLAVLAVVVLVGGYLVFNRMSAAQATKKRIAAAAGLKQLGIALMDPSTQQPEKLAEAVDPPAVYVGKNLSKNYPLDQIAVLAYQHPKHFGNKGMTVLRFDGGVNWVDAPMSDSVIKELEAGQNPPPSLKITP